MLNFLDCLILCTDKPQLQLHLSKNPTNLKQHSHHQSIKYHQLIPVGRCTWRCYTRSIIEQSLSFGPIAYKLWFPADIHLSVKYQNRKSYLKIVFTIPPEDTALLAFKEGERCEKTISFYKNRFWRIKQDLYDAQDP